MGLSIATCKSSPPLLEAEFAGCDGVRSTPSGPVCELPRDSAVRLWVNPEEGAEVRVFVDGAEVHADETPLSKGKRLRVQAAPTSQRLVARATKDGRVAEYLLALEPRVTVPALDDAERLRKEGKRANARALLAPLIDDSRPIVRARATGKVARVDGADGNEAGLVSGLETAISLAHENNAAWDEVNERGALAYHYLVSWQRGKARSTLQPVAELGKVSLEASLYGRYYEGCLAAEAGDLRTALGHFAFVDEQAERLGVDDNLTLSSFAAHWDALQRAGREQEAAVLVQRAYKRVAAQPTACKREELLNNIGWFELERRDVEGESADARLLRAAKDFEDSIANAAECKDAGLLGLGRANLARVRLELGSVEQAQEELAKAELSGPALNNEQAASRLEVEGRVALAQKKHAIATAAFERLALLARTSAVASQLRIATFGQAQALEASGAFAKAEAAYDELERLLDDEALLVPLGEGRGSFLNRTNEATVAHLELLLRPQPGKPSRAQEAFALARRGRARALRMLRWIDRIGAFSSEEVKDWDRTLESYRSERASLEKEGQDDWKLSNSELKAATEARKDRDAKQRAAFEAALAMLNPGHSNAQISLKMPREGELFLLFHPAASGWIGFAAGAASTRVIRIPAIPNNLDPQGLSERLLAPFKAEIEGATRLRVFPYGSLSPIAWHALPFDGAPLQARVPVEYGLDIGEPERHDPSDRRALVVVDPRGDLQSAREEAQVVNTALSSVGIGVDILQGQSAAQTALRDGLERANTVAFHYAGHGVFGGRDGWESVLPLADGGVFTVSDVLALKHVPARVVLSGCETGATDQSAGVGLGIAQAFLVAGASWVVASSRPVNDVATLELMKSFYSRSEAVSDPAEALRAAELSLRDRKIDWDGFRVFVP
jgi:hypothetical protein